MPLVHAVAAKIEAHDLPDFLTDPTKLSKGLIALQQILGADGIVSSCATGLEAEAAGGELDWSVYPPRFITHPAAGGSLPASVLERMAQQPRVAAAIEATRRLAGTVSRDLALVAALTGPTTLARQLGGPSFDQARQSNDPVSDHLFELASQISVDLARQFCQAGDRLVFLIEDFLPEPGGSAFAAWQSAVTPIANVIRFHQALPVLLPLQLRQEQARLILDQPPGGILLCVTPDTTLVNPMARPVGLAVPHTVLGSPVQSVAHVLLTTAGEVPIEVEIADFRAVCQSARATLSSELSA
jgi:hypothetical protein